jgi:hypothetical protein
MSAGQSSSGGLLVRVLHRQHAAKSSAFLSPGTTCPNCCCLHSRRLRVQRVYRLVSAGCSLPLFVAVSVGVICSGFLSLATRCSLFGWTFNLKDVGSNPTRPTSICRSFFSAGNRRAYESAYGHAFGAAWQTVALFLVARSRALCQWDFESPGTTTSSSARRVPADEPQQVRAASVSTALGPPQ